MRLSMNVLATLAICLLAAGCGSSSGPGSAAALQGPAGTAESASGDFAEGPSTMASPEPAADMAASGASDSFAYEEAEADYGAASPAGSSSGPAPLPAEVADRDEVLSERPATRRDEAASPERERPRQQQRRTGQLTAGSIDDVERVDEFCAFLNQTLDSWPVPGAVVDARPRMMLEVTTEEGLPVGGAELSVEPIGSQQPSIPLTTGSDGRAMLTLAEIDPQGRYEVVIRAADTPPIRRKLSLEENACRIVLPDHLSERPQQLDLALIIDTTGSMGDELEYLKTEIDGIVARLRETFPNVDQRFALILYRDRGDQYVSRTFDFTRSLDEMRGELARQRASGGGDKPEAVHVALQQAAGLDWRRGNVARVAFLVGDAPPHDSDMLAAFDATMQLRASGVRLYPVASSGVELKAEFLMRSAAFVTMGQYLFLTDHSGIGNPHAKPHTSQYAVEHLDRLMVRMITSELCGRRLQPDEILAIEQGDLELPYGPATEPGQQRYWRYEDSQARAAFTIPKSTRLWLTIGAVLVSICVFDSIRDRGEA